MISDGDNEKICQVLGGKIKLRVPKRENDSLLNASLDYMETDNVVNDDGGDIQTSKPKQHVEFGLEHGGSPINEHFEKKLILLLAMMLIT